jgi:hypothetical protein
MKGEPPEIDFPAVERKGNTMPRLVEFHRHRIALFHNGSVGMALGHISGSRGLDLILPGGEGQKSLVWYEFPHWTKHIIARGTYDYNVGCAALDVDGDGHPDVVIIRRKTPVPYIGSVSL